jgi:hypothetical protein
VLGLYGLLYAYAARRLDRARPIVAVGLLGKVLGPLGWALAVSGGEWPVRTVTLILLDDVVWWLPFSLFLLEGTRLGERLRGAAPLVCAGTNAVAALGMLVLLRPGTEVQPDAAARAAYVASHLLEWRVGWMLWVAAASTLIAFFAWWSARASRRALAVAGFAVGALGLFFDATAESIFVGWMPERMDLARRAAVLSGGVANGLYCSGGLLLTLAIPDLPSALRRWSLAIWVAGLGLTAATVAWSVPWIVACTAAVMALFLPWVVVVGRRLR